MRALVALLVVLLLPGCFLYRWPTISCTTRCGVKVLAPVAPEWCSEPWEEAALRAFEQVAPTDPRFASACQALNGWSLIVKPVKNFQSETEHKLVGGETDCYFGKIYVGNSSPMIGRVEHEFSHAIQHCVPLLPTDKKDPFHSNWGPIFESLVDAGFPKE